MELIKKLILSYIGMWEAFIEEVFYYGRDLIDEFGEWVQAIFLTLCLLLIHVGVICLIGGLFQIIWFLFTAAFTPTAIVVFVIYQIVTRREKICEKIVNTKNAIRKWCEKEEEETVEKES